LINKAIVRQLMPREQRFTAQGVYYAELNSAVVINFNDSFTCFGAEKLILC
jgi:hypothetical protein